MGKNWIDSYHFASVMVPPSAIVDSVVLKLRCRANCNRSISIRANLQSARG